jgi:peptidoglycan/LPS O-acetylase OafA/YrhL
MTTATDVRTGPPTPPVGRAAGRRRDIQGLRAIAVLLVVLFHAELPVPGGFVGVDVFFVISGFVITAMLMREWAQHGRIRFAHFYFRRFLRLTPALALVVAVVALASVFLQNPFGAQQATGRTGIGAMLLSANYVIGHAAGDYFADNATTNPLLHTWSLSVEEQFYLVFPAILALAWLLVRRGRRRAPVVIVTMIAAASFALAVAWSFGSTAAEGLTSYFGGPESFAFYSSLTRAWEFAAGALLALLLARIPVPTVSVARLLGLAGALLLLVSAFAIQDSQPFPGLVALLPVAGTVLLILAGSHHTTGVSSVLSTRPMVWLGDISYSWYLWHWPLIVFTALLFPHRPVLLVAAAAFSLVPAVASYRWLEQPLRGYRPRTRPAAGALVAATLAVPLAACLALLAGASTGWGLLPPASAAAPLVAGQPAQDPAATDADPKEPVPADGDAEGDGEVAGGAGGSLRSQHAVVKAGCVNTDLEPDRCRFGPTNASGTVLLAGDSQAYALADGVIAAAERLGLDTVATSHTGCPFLARESSGVHNYPCGSWQGSIVEYALAERPAAVVITNRSGGYVRPGVGWRTIERDGGGRAESAQEAVDLYRRGLEPVVERLSAAGIPVVIVAAVPEMTGYTDRTSLLSSAFGSQAFEIGRDEAERFRLPALEVEQALAAQYPGVVVHDPMPALCPGDVCSTERDGSPVYQDETHLAVPGSLLLADGLEDAISRAAPGAAAQPR